VYVYPSNETTHTRRKMAGFQQIIPTSNLFQDLMPLRFGGLIPSGYYDILVRYYTGPPVR